MSHFFLEVSEHFKSYQTGPMVLTEHIHEACTAQIRTTRGQQAVHITAFRYLRRDKIEGHKMSSVETCREPVVKSLLP